MHVNIIGQSESMIALLTEITRWAPTPYHILIEGETGSGKELVAGELHRRSARSKETLQFCNCAALAETLLESELFGHVEGAFTGATKNRDGRFTTANKSTLFLDEINSAGKEFQAKLLRAMESREIYRVGDSEPQPHDVRVIAATNATIEKSDLRPDLVYRFQHVLRVPPLRVRGDRDIELLARAFVEETSQELIWKAPEIDEDALQPLFRHSWPGNVRELKNVMRRVVVECRRDKEPAPITRDLVERALPGNAVASADPTTPEQRCIDAIADLVFAEIEAGRPVTLDGLTKAKSGATKPGELALILIRGLSQAVNTYVRESSKPRAVALRDAPTVNALTGLIGLTADQDTSFARTLRAEIKAAAADVGARSSSAGSSRPV